MQVDFFFLSNKDSEKMRAGLTMVDTKSGSTVACGLPGKQAGAYVIEFICDAINHWGYKEEILKGDQENALKNLGSAVRDKRVTKTILEHSPK